MDWSQLFSDYAPSLGFGGVVGVAVGYTTKKVTKLIALAFGATFILVQVLAYYGYITVNWNHVEHQATEIWSDGNGVTLADHAWEILRANLPFGSAFVAGFAIGFKLG